MSISKYTFQISFFHRFYFTDSFHSGSVINIHTLKTFFSNECITTEFEVNKHCWYPYYLYNLSKKAENCVSNIFIICRYEFADHINLQYIKIQIRSKLHLAIY